MCACRFLRAVKWAASEKATERLEETLKWRREFGLYDLVTADLVEPEVSIRGSRERRLALITPIGCDWERNTVRPRHEPQTRVLYDPKPSEYDRGRTADTVCGLDARANI